MKTVMVAFKSRFIRRLLWLCLIVLIIALFSFLTGTKLGAILQSLTPPNLPIVQTTGMKKFWPEQNWDEQIRNQYHHISQGTRTLPVPLDWLLALERPASSLWLLPFGDKGRFADNEYLLRFGFIEGELSDKNPHGLPVGIATTPSQTLPGIANKVTAVGFNCAACHTGHFVYENTEYIIEGGPAMTDLGLLTKALGAALGQTLLSSKVPGLKGRFNRFAQRVLGDDANLDININNLATELESLVENLSALPGDVKIVEGFSRLDALNRIGNQIFALDPGKFENYVAIDAPVNYPHIWTASWFSWVQYDGSIMNPLVRNTGEAMGVSAYLNTTAPDDEKRFSSSVDVDNLYWIEKALGGDDPVSARRFNGLLSPRWPDSLPPINFELVAKGATIYNNICKACHLPAPDTDEFWKYFVNIPYRDSDNEQQEIKQALLNVEIISQEQVGTDPAQSNVLKYRKVNTAGIGNSNGFSNFRGMGLNTQVCIRQSAVPASPYNPGWPIDRFQLPSRNVAELVHIDISDGPAIAFSLALGGIVQQTNTTWFNVNNSSQDIQDVFLEGRPNCLQAGMGYKARPLNGVWATAPFLHNGSVPTIYDLLSPPQDRPDYVLLGDLSFDPVNLGLAQDPELADNVRAGEKYDRDGFFILDTAISGNHNSGHEFSERWNDAQPWWNQPKGVIGPAFSHNDRMAIIEFLKSLNESGHDI